MWYNLISSTWFFVRFCITRLSMHIFVTYILLFALTMQHHLIYIYILVLNFFVHTLTDLITAYPFPLPHHHHWQLVIYSEPKNNSVETSVLLEWKLSPCLSDELIINTSFLRLSVVRISLTFTNASSKLHYVRHSIWENSQDFIDKLHVLCKRIFFHFKL